VDDDGFDHLFLRRRRWRRSFVMMARRGDKQEWRAGEKDSERRGLVPFHGTISVAAAKLSW
jgi:hypothetical protein